MTLPRTCSLAIAVVFFGAGLGAALAQSLPRGTASSDRDTQHGEPWCSDKGCTNWWNHYSVRIDAEKIVVSYRSTHFEIFKGTIHKELTENEKGWRISGSYTPPPVSCSDGGRRRSEADLARRLAWQAYSPDGENVWNDDSQDLKKPLQLSVTHLGKMRSAEERTQRLQRYDEKSRGQRAVPLKSWGRPRSEKERMQRKRRLETTEGGLGKREAQALTPPAVSLEKASLDARDRGRFARFVEGVIDKGEAEITLHLPHLPVLNWKCTVVRIVEPDSLVLVKQSATYKKPPEKAQPKPGEQAKKDDAGTGRDGAK